MAATTARELTEAQHELINELRKAVAELQPEEGQSQQVFDEVIRESFDEAGLHRYARANGWNMKKAFAQVRESIHWRVREQPSRPCERCLVDPAVHSLRVVGFDTLNRPCQYQCYGQASEITLADKHLAYVLENAIRHMTINNAARGLNVEHWVSVVDFEGYSLRDIGPKVIAMTKSCLVNYAERLGLLICIDAPWLFSSSYKLIKPLLEEVTVAKIQFVSLSNFEEKFREVLGEELTQWLLAEMKENRSSAAKHKKYWEHLNADGTPKPHDARGTPSFVASPHYRFPFLTPK